MKYALLLPALILSASHAIGADMREWAPYKKLVESLYVDKFHATPASERDKLLMFLMLVPSNKNISPGAVVLTLVHAGGRQAMPVSANGRVDFVFNPAWVNEGAMLFINQPKGEKMGLGFGFDARLPDGLQWRYASLMGSVRQANELIRRHAGALSLFAPKMKVVSLKFARPAQVKIQAKGGVLTLASDANNTIRLKPDDALLQENPMMILSERALEAELKAE
ncbi:MAG: hypothetical protein WA191_06480 [Telluria sp.]